jgi:hypothetical protein
MEKLRNSLANDAVRGRQSTMYRAQRLAEFALYDSDPRLVDSELDHYLNVTAADIKRATARYLDSTNRVVLSPRVRAGRRADPTPPWLPTGVYSPTHRGSWAVVVLDLSALCGYAWKHNSTGFGSHAWESHHGSHTMGVTCCSIRDSLPCTARCMGGRHLRHPMRNLLTHSYALRIECTL